MSESIPTTPAPTTPAPAPAQAKGATDFTGVSITSDGTLKGTVITINGVAIAPESFDFSFYRSEYSGTHLNISWSEEDKDAVPGQIAGRRYFRFVPATLKRAIAAILPCTAQEADPKVLPRGNSYANIGNKPGQSR